MPSTSYECLASTASLPDTNYEAPRALKHLSKKPAEALRGAVHAYECDTLLHMLNQLDHQIICFVVYVSAEARGAIKMLILPWWAID